MVRVHKARFQCRDSGKRRVNRLMCAVGCALFAVRSPPVCGAELRFTYGEMAALIGRLSHLTLESSDREGMPSIEIGLHVGNEAIATTTFTLQSPQFNIAGARYALLPMAPITMAIRSRHDPRQSRLGLEIAPRAASITMSAECIHGPCIPVQARPRIVWHQPRFSISFSPAQIGPFSGIRSNTPQRSIARPSSTPTAPLQVAGIEIAGNLSLACPPSWLPAELGCGALQAMLAADLPTALERTATRLGDATNRVGLAALLNSAIPKGAAASQDKSAPFRISVDALLADDDGVRVSFCLLAACP